MMRKFAWLISFGLLMGGLSLAAQDMRTVRGMVAAPDGQVIPNATLKADGIDTPFKANRVGQFEIKIPFSCQKLTAYVDGYTPLTLDVVAGYLLFKMKPVSQAEDNAAAGAAAAGGAATAGQAAATAQAGGQSANQGGSTSTSSNAQAARQDQAEREALAKAKAEREQAEREKAETDAQSRQSKKVSNAEKGKAAYEQRKNTFAKKGLAQQVELSYAYQLYSGDIVYANSGARKYSALHPVQLTYAIGWRFNPLFTLTGGVGCLFNIQSLERTGDSYESELYGNNTPRRFDIPVFINARLHFLHSPVQPYVSLTGGIYALSLAPLADLGIGAYFHLNGKVSLTLAVSARNTPWPLFTGTGFEGYPFRIVPAITAGIQF